MSDFFFSIVCGFILLILQQFVQFHIYQFHFSFGLIPLFIIYIGFTYSFTRGFVSVIFLSLIIEAFSFVPMGYLVVTHLILFTSIQVLEDQMLAESYITKSFWVIVFGTLNFILVRLVVHPVLSLSVESAFWLELVLNILIWSVASIPLFIFLDQLHGMWRNRFSMKRADLTGADLYQVKSNQRKYLK